MNLMQNTTDVAGGDAYINEAATWLQAQFEENGIGTAFEPGRAQEIVADEIKRTPGVSASDAARRYWKELEAELNGEV